MQPKTTRQIIREARRILRQPNRWEKGSLGSKHTSMCLLGGIAAASGLELENVEYKVLRGLPAVQAVASVITRKEPNLGRFGGPESTVYRFNDRHSTTHADVIDLLTETLKSLPKES